MEESGFNKLYWGFLFIMLSFRIQGLDILPDVVGYLLFAFGFKKLALRSEYFDKAAKYNIPMIIISIFSIYQRPNQGGGIDFGPWGSLGLVVAIVSFILNLLIVYNLFMGIQEIARSKGEYDIDQEAGERWNQYKMLQIGFLLLFVLAFIPMIGLVCFIVIFVGAIVLTIKIMGFMRKCDEQMS